MKKLIAMMCMVPAIVFGGNAQQVKEHLNQTFDVQKVTFVGGVLRITLNERMITQDIYQSVFENGILLYALGYGETKGALKNMKGFIVQNKFKKQGFAFSGSEADVLLFKDYDRKKTKIMLFGKSIVVSK